MTRALAAIDRVAPPASAYAEQAREVLEQDSWLGWKAHELVAIVTALRDDYRAGAIHSVADLLHADMFEDLLDMARELFTKGFLGPAAVLAGSVLEEHLRKLAIKHRISVRDEKDRVRSVEVLSIDLRKAGALTDIQRKSIVAWYAQRNEAAHGRFESLAGSEVGYMINGVRDFIAHHPA